jgi:hypothetical protein
MPEVVYHYTTIGTMMKIAETASIWATSVNYLNDVSEGDYFRELVRQRIPEYLITHKVDDATIFDEFLAASPGSVETRPFVASFSQDGDSLPQWRSYCPNGNGVAVGFKVDCLKCSFIQGAGERVTRQKIPWVRFLKVDYLDTQTSQSVDREITQTLEMAETLLPFKNMTSGGIFRFLMQLMTCAKKHISFSNEREFRLILDGVNGNNDWLDFRPTRSSLVPYVALGIPRKHSGAPKTTTDGETTILTLSEQMDSQILRKLGGRWDFIDRVVIGPSPNKDLSLAAVDLFFQKQNMNVEVVPSTIPYREW